MVTAALSAAVAYKKVDGALQLTRGDARDEQALLWTPAGESTASLRIAASKLKCRRSGIRPDLMGTALFASKDGGAKVMIRIAVEGEAGAPETLYNFTCAGLGLATLTCQLHLDCHCHQRP